MVDDADADADVDVDNDNDDEQLKEPTKTGDTRYYMLVAMVAVSSLIVLASTYRKREEN